ncbi:MAG: glycosyltransferase family 87 protein [Promethearchaeota archaeon]
MLFQKILVARRLSVKEACDRLITRWKQLWEYKIFRYAVFVHLSFFTIACILVFFDVQNDFEIFHKAGQVFLDDLSNLYDQFNYTINGRQWDFRYFPLSVIFFLPFSLLDFKLAFILFNVVNLLLNALVCIILFKLIHLIQNDDGEKNEKRIITYISIYLMSALHVFNYVLGQINLIVSVLVLSSLYILLKYDNLKWQLIGSVILGITVIVKPITIFILPFLILMKFNKTTKKFHLDLKLSLIRIIGFLIPVSLNIFFFITIPRLFNGFWETNFSGTNPVDINFSFSITKLIINFCYIYFGSFNQLLILFIVLAIIGPLAMIFYLLGNQKKDFLTYGYLFGTLVMLLVYYDSWNHHLLVLTPLIILIIFNQPEDSEISRKYMKPPFYLLCFFDLPFLGLWYLTRDFFPFNFAFTVGLILIFYGISLYSINNELTMKSSK